MPILHIILILIVIGVILWLVNTKIPMQPWVKTLLNVIVIIFIIVWLLKITGLWSSLSSVRV